MENSYKNSGVDIEAGEKTVHKIKKLVRSTFDKNVLSDIGLFGSFYDLNLKKYNRPVLVSSVDGVGTKLKVAFAMDKHDTVGQDLVNHCVNDIAVCGAQPLYFLDYMAFGKLDPNKAAKIIEGFTIACKENKCSLVGGETAEMPGIYADDEYDMSGTIVGVVEKKEIINGKNIKKGDVLIGFPSNGLHTNGYSLARKVVLEKYKVDYKPEGFTKTIGEELLKTHKSYLPLITKLKTSVKIKGFSHITGGGIIGNTSRIIPKGLKLKIDWSSWEVPQLFKFIQTEGNISDEEMRKVFNIGIVLIAVVSAKHVDEVLEISKKMKTPGIVMGKVS